jgi:hypothetical protein
MKLTIFNSAYLLKMSKSSLRMFIHGVVSKHGSPTNSWGILNDTTISIHINEAITHEISIVSPQFPIPWAPLSCPIIITVQKITSCAAMPLNTL